jgi:hypothetical protein
MEEGEGAVAKDKARARNLVANTGWYIYPVGKSPAFDGSSQYATLPSGTFPFRYYDDFTIELQFKGGSQGAMTLLSVGAAAYIGFNAGHKLILTTGGNTQVLSDANLLNDQWHHIALSVKRNGMTTAVTDGVVSASFSSSIFSGDVAGGLYYLGVRYNGYIASPQYDNYFAGNIDELRVWNTALSTESIRLNKDRKLTGTEKALKAYYPFETWTRNPDGTYNVLAHDKDMVDAGNTLGGTGVIDGVAAGMIDARPVTDVPFTWTSSSNKVVINITEPLYRIEGVTLNITAQGIRDMRGNESKPAKWIAYVNLNPLNWTTDKIDLAIEHGTGHTFKASITNGGGASADYYVDNLPSWLTVNAPSGTLQPLATKELTFTVSQGINIGSYEASVVLSGINNVKKILPVRLKVTGERPDWSVNPNDYEFSMNVTGQVQILGAFQEDEDDIVGAFIGDLCVGVGSPEYVRELNAYYLFLDVYGNAAQKNRPVTFKLWDAGTGRIYPQVEASVANMVFKPSEICGTIVAPVLLNATDIMEQSIALKKGWTWMSANVLSANPSIFSQMKTSLNDVGIKIQARSIRLIFR